MLLVANGYCLLFVHIGRRDHSVVFGKTRRSFKIRYNKHVSDLNYKKFTPKSNFAKPVLEHDIYYSLNIFFTVININKKLLFFLVFRFGIKIIFHLQSSLL